MRETNVWKTVGILAAVFVGMFVLASLADAARVTLALEWSRMFVGILVTVAGVGAATIALTDADSNNRLLGTGPGVVGALAGGTLLGVGDWAAPAALGVTGVAAAIGYALKR